MKDTNNQGKSFQERLAEAEERRKNATISDIIAAKRREADSIEASARGSFKAGEDWDERPFTESDLESALDLAETKRKEAARLEAAQKRERGDCAKLREALVSVQKKIHYLIGSLNVPNSLVANRMEINGIINAALAEPPRNCDRPECATTKAAQDVWRKEDGGKTAYYEWLLATATEKKGGNDGN